MIDALGDFIENFPDFKAADKTIQDQKNDKQQKYHGVLPVDVQHNHQNGQETDRDDFRKICDCRDDPADYRLRQSLVVQDRNDHRREGRTENKSQKYYAQILIICEILIDQKCDD